MTFRTCLAVAACLLGSSHPEARAGDLAATGLDLQRVTWKELRFSAHKLGISATFCVRLETPTANPTGVGVERGPGAAATDPAETTELLLESTTHLPGRTFLTRERIDPAQGTVREIVDTETGVRHHCKTYTLTSRGFLLDVLEPASMAETLLQPGRWTQHSRSFAAYPQALTVGDRITGPAGLLYAASAAGLSAPGDSLAIHVLVQTQVERVTVRVEGIEPVQVDYQQESGGRLNSVREQLDALSLVVHSEAVDPAASSVFRLFGLEGDVRLVWDPGRRLPVEMSGQMKLLGHVVVRLASVILR
jgi:hypothetical protein